MAPQQPKLGPGDVAPMFVLRTSAGRDIRLTDVLQAAAAMVVFIRGTW
jgi:hypothetical protein